jgi:hypothetical protein
MEKIKVKTLEKKDIELSYFGESIFINQIIKIAEQQRLREVYLEAFFKNGKEKEWDEQFANFMFRREILKLKTNIDIESIEDTDAVDILIWGKFYDEVKSSIVNYQEVENVVFFSLSNIVRRMEIETSAGYLLKELISKFSPMLEELSNLTPESFEKLKSSSNELIEKIKDEPVVASILNDMNGNKPASKKSKKVKEYVQ